MKEEDYQKLETHIKSTIANLDQEMDLSGYEKDYLEIALKICYLQLLGKIQKEVI